MDIFLNEHGVFEVHVSLVQNLELLPLARIMMQLSHVQIRKELKLDFKNFQNFESLKTFTVTSFLDNFHRPLKSGRSLAKLDGLLSQCRRSGVEVDGHSTKS